jgi:DNA-binding GntR family transcriptional regulator
VKPIAVSASQARAANLARMAPRATGDQVYEDLHGRIVRGDLRPGDPLFETKVAESYGLSRTPVREVFWRLGEAGFIRVVPQVGTFVAAINVAAVHDAQFIRETLECRAVADAAQRRRRWGCGTLSASSSWTRRCTAS